MSIVGKAIGSITGSTKAAQAAQEGAAMSAAGQTEALNYLKQTEALPQELREGALSTLGGLYGLGDVDPATALGTIKGSEMYKQVLGSRGAGEEAILRNASATGGLRSGNASDALARYNMELEQQAFNSGLSGLQGLSGLPSNANNIATITAGIGDTLGQGRVAAGQAQAAGRGGLISGALGFGTGLAKGGFFNTSDARFKTNIKPAGKRNGHHWYTWIWSKEAEALGLFGSDEGVMAHEVAELKPEAVQVRNGYLTVNYDALGVN